MKNRNLARLLLIMAWFFLAVGLVHGVTSAAGAVPADSQPVSVTSAPDLPVDQKIDREVVQAIQVAPAADKIPIIITMRDQANLSLVQEPNRDARLTAVVQLLRNKASTTQGPIRAFLDSKRQDGSAGPVTAFWVFNGLAVPANGAVIQQLAARPDVLRVSLDLTVPAPQLETLDGNIEWNVEMINAPALWAWGLRGQGTVVASLDTGVSLSHADLTGRWRGGSNSWFDPYGENATPADWNGHGTQTMGIMVGGSAGGSAIGGAPEAQWIAAKIFNNQGSGTTSAIHLSFQWILDPDNNPATPDAPHVVNNSWNFSGSGCNLEFQLDLQALRAAGILPIFAAGNSGPSSGMNASPANNPEAFAVGAIDRENLIYYYSSRGPSSCGEAPTVFPELAAPGVNVLTSSYYGGYQLSTGTSIAAPHVSAGLALLLGAFPNLTADEQQAALLASAVDLGPSGPDQLFGHGRLDLLAAYQYLGGTAPDPTQTPVPTSSPTPLPPTPGEPTPTPLPPTPSPTPSPIPITNLALGKSVSVSSSQDSTNSGSQAVDGSLSTTWQSKKLSKPRATTEWIQVDLGGPALVSQIVFQWDAYYATRYTLQGSLDGSTWTTLFTVSSGDGGTDSLQLEQVQARYLKMVSDSWSDALYRCWLKEFEIFGSASQPPASVTPTPTPVLQSMRIGDLDAMAVMSNANRWNASVAVRVVSAQNAPLAGVVVSGEWNGSASGSAACTTDSLGSCTVSLNNLKTSVTSVNFSVNGASLAGYIYTPEDNFDPDGDSDGTTILVQRP